MMVSVRRLDTSDVEMLVNIGGATLLESHGHSAPQHVMHSYVDEKFSKTWLLNELNDTGNIFHGIFYKGQAVGYSKIIYNVPITTVQASNITKMERLYILQQFHGHKLGQHLMNFNVELSKANGQQGMWLYVWKGNDRALKFYTTAGFKIVGDGFFRLTDEHSNPNWQMYLQF